MRPLLLFAVLYLVFTRIIRFGGKIPHYAVLLLMDIMLYQFFADATGTAMGSVVSGEPVVRKMHFPRIVIPLAVVASAAMTSAMNLVVVLGFMLATGVGPLHHLAAAAGDRGPARRLSAGVALLLSMAYVGMRDLGHVWIVALERCSTRRRSSIRSSACPNRFRWLYALNPLTPILYQARIWLVQPDAPSLVEQFGVAPLLGSILIAMALCAGGVWLFVRRAPQVAEAL